MFWKIYAVLACVVAPLCVGLELHSKCSLASGQEGTCRLFKDCLSAKQLVLSGVYPVLCSYEFVCCQKEAPEVEAHIDAHVGRLSSEITVSSSCYAGPTTDGSREDTNDFLYRTASSATTHSQDLDMQLNFMVKIGFRKTNGDLRFYCGGTLITRDFVLTAAHCTDFKGQAPEVVQIGNSAENFAASEDDLERIPISKIHIHPDYSSSTVYQDIALLELAVTSSHLPACLGQFVDNDLRKDSQFAVGHDLKGDSKLQFMDLEIMSPSYCNELYTQMRKIPHGLLDSQLCLGKSNISDAAACRGYIGGPLLARKPNGQFYVFGLASFVQQCYSTIYPMIYTKISAYKDWLQSIIE